MKIGGAVRITLPNALVSRDPHRRSYWAVVSTSTQYLSVRKLYECIADTFRSRLAPGALIGCIGWRSSVAGCPRVRAGNQ
eukprot:2588182-Rhodomonas_salina.3